MKYRPEIDGLRAVAVLAVILFHAGFGWMSGGFVGVDVFFVISGYLMTTLLLEACESHTLSISNYYERRVRRLVPALVLVVGFCVPLAYLVMLPDQLEDFSRSVLSVWTLISNVYFQQDVGYFAQSGEQKPLLHTWSLSIEAQYYLVFPWLVLLLRPRWPRVFVLFLVSVSVASFLSADRSSLLQQSAAFWDTRNRVWEFGLGSVVALYLLHPRAARNIRVLHELGAALGLGMIAWASILFEQSAPFPGRHALIPAVGAALVILCADSRTTVGKLLRLQPVVGLGLISYSAYLWHVPVFVFARLTSPARIMPLQSAALAVLAIGLGYLTWRYVETPCRATPRSGARRTWALSAVAVAGLAVAVLPGAVFDGLPSRFQLRDSDLAVSHVSRGVYVRAHHQALSKAGPFDPQGGFKLLIIGDSHSQDLVNMLREGSLFHTAQIRVRYIPVRCQVYVGDEPISALVDAGSVGLCSRDYYDGIDTLIADADAVFIASSWVDWSARRLPVTIERLQLPFAKQYFVFGKKGFGYVNRAAYVGWSVADKAAYRNQVGAYVNVVNAMLRQTLEPGHFVDLQAILCGNDAGVNVRCPLFDESGALLSYDGSHLTQAGARFFGSRLAAIPAVSRLNELASQEGNSR
jgi:peptidoglycan/LPS O-acetylase OafA/YrhL